MKIAAVSEDGLTVSQHFGRAPSYVVLTVEAGEVVARETRPKVGHQEFAGGGEPGPGPARRHRAMADAIGDCEALIAGGMGSGAFESLRSVGITPVLTDVTDITEAALRHARGDLPNLGDRIHQGRGREQRPQAGQRRHADEEPA